MAVMESVRVEYGILRVVRESVTAREGTQEGSQWSSGNRMVGARSAHGWCMVDRESHGRCMVARNSHGWCMVCAWLVHGRTEFAWSAHGSCMVAWNSHGSVMALQRNPILGCGLVGFGSTEKVISPDLVWARLGVSGSE